MVKKVSKVFGVDPIHRGFQHEEAKVTGDRGVAVAIGDRGVSSAIGDRGGSVATGDCGVSSASGYCGVSSATGGYGSAVATGDYGVSSVTGDCGGSSVSGYCGAAVVTGYYGSSSVSDPTGIAVAWGHTARAMGCIGAHLILSDWRYIGEITDKGKYYNPYDEDSWELVGAKMVIVDGETIKAGTYYRCVDGEILEVDKYEEER